MKKKLLPFIALQLLLLLTTANAQSLSADPGPAAIRTVLPIVSGVYFYEGDKTKGHSNNGWVIFDDFVLVIDANYPSGAKVVMPLIRQTTDLPMRFVFDTHHHWDHAYGNQIWAEAGATIISTTKMLEEMKKVETGYFGGGTGRWEASAAKRPDVAATHLKPPTILFPDEMIFDDGKHRVELHWFGSGHTPGDGYAWLPKEKILFTGDACVNGPSNNVDDSNINEWIKTLEIAKKLGAVIVCPGHGPRGGPEIIVDQQAYLVELQHQVKALMDGGKSAAEIKAAIPTIASQIKKIPNIARYLPGNLTRHIQKVYLEFGGVVFPQ